MSTQCTLPNSIIGLAMSICRTVEFDFLPRERGDLNSLARPHNYFNEIP